MIGSNIRPPMGGEKQWKDGRSPKELARYFTSALLNVPEEIEAVLSNLLSTDSPFEWAAEYVTDLTSHHLGRGDGRYHSEEKISANEKDIKRFLSHSNAIENDGYWTVPTVYGRENNIDLHFSEITIELQ